MLGMTWQRLGNIALAITILLICDAIFATIGKRVIPEWRHSTETGKYRIQHPVYHHGVAPNVASVYAFGDLTSTYFTNSLGLRDSKVRYVPAQGERPRVVLMGDSFTEGAGLTFSETYAGRIQMAMEKRGVEVLNGAVASYAPTVYLSKLRHLIETQSVKMDEVVLFLDVSDIWDEATCYFQKKNGGVGSRCGLEERPVKRFKRWLAEHSMLYHMYRTIKDGNKEGQRRENLGHFQAVTDWDRARWTMGDDLKERIRQPGLAQARARMDDIKQLLERHNIAFSVVVYPWADQIAGRDLDSIHVRYWQDWAKENKIQFFNLFPVFFEEDPKVAIERYFTPFDPHYNAAGNALLGDAFLAAWTPAVGGR